MVPMNTTNLKRLFRRSVFGAALLVACVTGALEAQQAVTWTNQQNVAVRGSSLEKTGGCQGCDDAGAVSQQMIRSGNGFAEFTVGENDSFWMAGLSQRDGNANFGNMDFAIRFNGNGWADVLENGSYVGGDTQYRAGDVFRIEVAGDRVRYVRNGRPMYTSQRRPAYPLVFDVALGSLNSTIRNARISSSARDVAGFGAQDQFGTQDEFDTLDRNRDGRITRAEWRGTRRDFNLRDTNRDGILTRREVGVEDDFNAVGTAGEFITVNAMEQWTDTGVYVRAGDTITFQAEGTIQMSGDPNDTANPAGSRRRAPNAPLRQSAAGSLIARIGNSAPFVVGGNSRTVRAPANGQLFLGVNDDYLGDNSGEFRVMVTVDPR
jgi:PA-IL-like protein/EF hand domain-containing protein